MARKNAKSNDEEMSSADKADDNVGEIENIITEIDDEGEEDQLKIDDKEEEILLES